MDALIIVDMQNDFLPGGTLAVPNGDQIVGVVNKLCDCFNLVIATKDKHPKSHISFASTHHKKPFTTIKIGEIDQELWPDHCVENTYGENLTDELAFEKITKLFVKGTQVDSDSYSVFYDDSTKTSTKLLEYLKANNVSKVYIVGVAAEYCVKQSALDSASLGFETYVIKDAIAFLDQSEDSIISYFEEMRSHNIGVVSSQELLK